MNHLATMTLFMSLSTWVGILPNAFAESPLLTANDLKTGDVLVQSLPCYLCAMIEAEEHAPYSHAAVVIRKENEITALEAWGTVQESPLPLVLGLRKSGTTTLVLRPIDPKGDEIPLDAGILLQTFHSQFQSRSYDPYFLWDNRDANGEMLYCSEFVAKFLNPFLPVPLLPKPMHFNQYRQDWIRYFKGNPPDGALGLSPADFAASPLFKTIGDLK
jgi:hypothetical protein